MMCCLLLILNFHNHYFQHNNKNLYKGKSVFIDPNGKMIKSLEPFEAVNIELQLPIIESSNIGFLK